jgi:hypothetical protein
MKKFIVFAVFVVAAVAEIGAQKLKPEEIVLKHVDAIGSATARANRVNSTIVSDVIFAVGPASNRPVSGRSVFASQGDKLLYAMTFTIPEVPLEKITWNGRDIKVDFPDRGQRTAFGGYVFNNTALVSEGLFGGVLMTTWPLANVGVRGATLSLDGSKRIDGRESYVVGYQPKKGDGMTIKLYFDKETFRHVRTEYMRRISSQMGPRPDFAARQVRQETESFETLTEDFYDFKTENGLTVPRGYKVTLVLQRERGLGEYRYTFAIKDIFYNRELDPETFGPTGKKP